MIESRELTIWVTVNYRFIWSVVLEVKKFYQETMLGAFTSTSILGLILGRFLDVSPWKIGLLNSVEILLCLICFWCLAGKYQKIGISCAGILGLIWGFCHAAPAPKNGQTFKVLDVDVFDERAGPILGAVRDKAVESYGSRIPYRSGRVLELPVSSAFVNTKTFVVVAKKRLEVSSLFAGLMQKMRQQFELRTELLPSSMRGWARGFLGGDSGGISKEFKDPFMRTGLYHLLVVSGLHVAVIAGLGTFLLNLPFRLAYSLRLMSPNTFQELTSATTLVACLIALIYCVLCGSSAASQRALILYLVTQVSPLFFGIGSLKRRLLLAFTGQVIFFPIGLISEGCVMSWSAFLLVIASNSHSFINMIKLQGKLVVITAAVFGQIPLIGFLTNPLSIPMFPWLLGSCLVEVISPHSLVGRFAHGIQTNFFTLIGVFDHLVEKWPWLYLTRDELPLWFRYFFFVTSCFFVLNALRDVTIKESMLLSEDIL